MNWLFRFFKLLVISGLIGLSYNELDKIYNKKETILSVKVTKCPANQIKDIYKLGFGNTTSGRTCRVVYKNGMKNAGTLSEAIAYFDAFVVRQLYQESEKQEIECFFKIDTYHYKLISQRRIDRSNGIESKLHFKARYCSSCLDVYYTIALTKSSGNTYDIGVFKYDLSFFPDCLIEILLTLIMAILIVWKIVWPDLYEKREQHYEYPMDNNFDSDEEDNLESGTEDSESEVEENPTEDQSEMPETEDGVKSDSEEQILEKCDNAEPLSAHYEQNIATTKNEEPNESSFEDVLNKSQQSNAVLDEVVVLLYPEVSTDEAKNNERIGDNSVDIGSDGSWYEIITE